jgi:SAM-dependent methyltransferase
LASDYDLKTNVKAYERWAPFYDKVYTNLLSVPRRLSVEAAVACGPEILEVGLGTGLSLPDYPAGVTVSGVDLSPHMLAKAQEKIDLHRLACVRGLAAAQLSAPAHPRLGLDAGFRGDLGAEGRTDRLFHGDPAQAPRALKPFALALDFAGLNALIPRVFATGSPVPAPWRGSSGG